MSNPRLRNALGLPAGSIRAILSLSILAMSWMFVLFAQRSETNQTVQQVPLGFIYLQFLMILILGHYFTSRMTPTTEEGGRSALWLPRGTIRFLILLTYGGLAYYLYHNSQNLTYDFQMTGNQILMVSLMFVGFILGHYFTLIARWWMKPIGEIPGWVLDIQAWFAILAMFGLLIVCLIHMINSSLTDKSNMIDPRHFEAGLTAVVGFYFGARS